MATLSPPASPLDPVLEIEHGTIDGKACAHAYYVAISEKSYEADDSGPGATRDKVLLATVTEDALRVFPINVRRGVADYLKPRHDSHDNLTIITIESDDYGWSLPTEPGDFEELLLGLPTGFSEGGLTTWQCSRPSGGASRHPAVSSAGQGHAKPKGPAPLTCSVGGRAHVSKPLAGWPFGQP